MGSDNPCSRTVLISVLFLKLLSRQYRCDVYLSVVTTASSDFIRGVFKIHSSVRLRTITFQTCVTNSEHFFPPKVTR
jgi:hypothetical protein